jgi:putative Holliday junction resolvase
MRLLGIDYGVRKMGLAVSSGSLAEPFKVISVSSTEEALEKIGRIVKSEGIEKIVVGVSEGAMGKESEDFGQELARYLKIPVDFEDETLTSQDSLRMGIEAGMKRKKRKEMEDAFAASVMLQSYIERK